MPETQQTPEIPPEIRAQQQPKPPQPGLFMQAGMAQAGQGPGAADAVGQLEQKIGELEKWAQDTMLLIEQVHKPAGALLVPIAQAGNALKAEIGKLRQRTQGAGPATPAGPAGAPGGAPPNPAEGVSARPAA